MRKTRITLLMIIAFMTTTVGILSVSAVTEEEARNAGAGFHEPSADWWDISYKYRIPINASVSLMNDVALASTSIDFSDYFSSGIIDLASMQLVEVLENESAIPTPFQVETDALDLWNPVTLKEVEEATIGNLLKENGTFIGTVYNEIEGGLLNQSIRFEVIIDDPTDEVKFQFIYQPEFEVGVDDDDYLQVMASQNGVGGTPIRIYRDELPENESTWTDYYILMLESEVSGKVWITFDAPSLQVEGHPISYFSIDFSFWDSDGFGRQVEHFLPEASAVESPIKQDNYYPRVQVLQDEAPPTIDLYFIGKNGDDITTEYFLYFNLMNESNHRIIDNEAVPFEEEIGLDPEYKEIDFNSGLLQINNTNGNITIYNESNYIVHDFMDFGGTVDVDKTLGTIISSVTISNSTAKAIYNLYKGSNFLETIYETEDTENKNITSSNTISSVPLIEPLTYFGNETDIILVQEVDEGLIGQSRIFSFIHENDKKFVSVIFNESIDYEISNVTTDNFTITMEIGNVTFDILIEEGEIPIGGNYHESILNKTNDMSDWLENRLDGNLVTTKDVAEEFAELQMFFLNKREGIFTYYVIGNALEIGLHGHSLQSITVEIPSILSETGSNGSFAIPSLSRGLFQRGHTIIIRGRNELGDTINLTATIWIADNTLDIGWTIILQLVSNLPVLGGILITTLTPVAILNRRRTIKKQAKIKTPKKDCSIEGECEL